MSDKCKDFINKCLSKDSKERIGYKNDVEEVIGHPWFADIDVNALINK
jgi:serum/glucocorticoid-regulated kinase 2